MNILQSITIGVVGIIYIYGLFKAIRGRSVNKWNIVLGFTLATLVVVYLILNNSTIAPSDWVQIILMFGLVLATIQYAISATKQADASIKMAEEMREQRIIASRPVIIQKSVYEKDIWEGSNKDYFSHFEISNVGNTPAIEVESSIVDNEGNSPHNIRQTYLSKDDPSIKFRPYGIANLEEDKTYYLICNYKSIFSYGKQKSLYQTRLPFKISKAAEEGKIYVIPGELETKEVTDKDFISAFGSKPK